MTTGPGDTGPPRRWSPTVPGGGHHGAAGGPPQASGVSAARAAVRSAVRDDAEARARALLVVRLTIALYLAELLLNLLRPHVQPHEPALSIFERTTRLSGSVGRLLATPRTVFWLVLAGIVAGVLLQVLVMATRPDERRARTLTWLTVAVVLGPFGLIPLTVIAEYPLQALACVPGTAFALALLHFGQRFSRIPAMMLLAAFAWGALVVFGLGRAASNLAFGTLYGFMGDGAQSDLTRLAERQYDALDVVVVHSGVVNALVVAAGVALLLVLFRHRVTDAVTGLVVGAAIGLGYNLVESTLIIRLFGTLSAFTGTTGGFEYWVRQSIGLLGGQVAFGAVLGAGFGLAAQARRRGGRTRAALAGLAAAICGAIATETLAAWLSRIVHDHVSVGGPLDTLVVSPFLWLLPQAPFIVVAVLLLAVGTRARAAAARDAVAAEAASGTAITRWEAPFLADPALRFWSLVSTGRLYGRGSALALRRLQLAQLDLAAWRWQHPGVLDGPAKEEGDRLRARVMLLRTRPGIRPAAAPRPGQVTP
ncbi:PrsW family glutamic-type intramembrane protease [Actinomadura fibrosa]|uniref:PrsW family glutamic-type intramembrane protease n=1 Tax=Actinomadura fibrosa TaxID=111802 RepID=A0ABW2XXQ9_9ACTN|nr:PrsW family glutamic-type intramembrane protease [Actinomadura fibrosa]